MSCTYTLRKKKLAFNVTGKPELAKSIATSFAEERTDAYH